MDQKRLILVFVSIIWSRVIAQDTTERCDVISAVQCFSNMAEVPKPHMLTDDPEVEILQPCIYQVNKNSALRSCLDRFLRSCNTVLLDANKMINISQSFCSNCLACPNFTIDYTAGLECTLDMFKTLVTPGITNNKQANCRTYSSCLIKAVTRCPALTVLLFDLWKLFETTCQRVNVSTPQELTTSESPPSLICTALDVVTMSLSDCYITFLTAVGPKDSIDVTSYCQAVKTYEECVDAVLTTCPLFHNIFKNSMQIYFIAIEGFCGANIDVDSVCDLQGLSNCFENIDARLWKTEKYIIEGIGESGFDLQNWSENVKQITDAAKSFTTVCSDVPSKMNTTASCLSSYISGCPLPLNEAYQMNANYLQGLCTVTTRCQNETFAHTIDGCGDRANQNIKELAKSNHTNEDEIVTSYCNIFKTMLTCLDTTFKECAEPSEHITALYVMLVDDLEPVCERGEFEQLKSVSLSSSMQSFLDCRYMPIISYEIGECSKTYLHTIARNHTNKQEICKAFDNWENCMDDVTLDCKVLQTHVQLMIKKSRSKLDTTCPQPPTQPPHTSQKEAEDMQTTISTNSTGVSVLQVKYQPTWKLCFSVLLLFFWMW